LIREHSGGYVEHFDVNIHNDTRKGKRHEENRTGELSFLVVGS